MRLATALWFAVSLAAQDADPEPVLARAREKILNVTHRLPRYTCLETIHRDYFEAPKPRPHKHELTANPATSCALVLDHPLNNLLPEGWDRVRLDVAVAGNHEIESWPGASRFDSRRLDQIVTTGPTSTGAFGTYLIEVFENAGAKIKFTSRHGGLLEYSFLIPRESSHYGVGAGTGFFITGTSGSFSIDPKTADLTQLIIATDVLPPQAQMCQAKTTIAYEHLRIGESDFLLPQSSTLETLHSDFSRTASVTTFSACHEYTAESTLLLDDQDAAAGSEAANSPAAPLPAGLPLSLALAAPIDSDTAAAGDLVFASVLKAVNAPHQKNVLIPKGSRVRGRISEMKYFADPTPHFQFGLSFDHLQIGGVWTPVTMEVDRGTRREMPPSALNTVRRSSGLRTRGMVIQLPLPGSDDGGLFVFAAKSPRYLVPAGYESKWVTRETKP